MFQHTDIALIFPAIWSALPTHDLHTVEVAAEALLLHVHRVLPFGAILGDEDLS